MPIIWIAFLAFLALIVWTVIRLTREHPRHDNGAAHQETADEILDRRYARGEIDADEYRQARANLTEHRRKE
ncbi:SHOCT domain-containing protein [Saccharopolyspora sp. NFXS83]|uniref:SHOCT domain-containing protein n=1 Tax=Saccharopolyspora sp. NFXS83 TaxID=2993560 RepID=UPI00224B4138|nr:SHOCT domain-containing protein [Saccharopolyspora sp. NFXS83]MCX2729387.1 SHOCT domain-containing protein [Saccharopolyspora sp. NFXS83]